MTKIKITCVGGKPWLKDLVLPVTVEAKHSYDDCHDVFAEEFRKFGIEDDMPETNNGRGLAYSFYDANQYEIIK